MARTKKPNFNLPDLDLDKLVREMDLNKLAAAEKKLKFSKADIDPARLGRYIKQNPREVLAMSALAAATGLLVYEKEAIFPLVAQTIPQVVVEAYNVAAAVVVKATGLPVVTPQKPAATTNKNCVCASMLPSHCPGAPYVRVTKCWLNYCPGCHRYGGLLCNPKGTYEGEWTCKYCDDDFDGQCGYEKRNPPRWRLTPC